jgi:PTH1 family peptidyl-tRNA hydrolase
VGLGNPGPEYEATRHNAGFLLADHLARRWGVEGFRRDGPSRVAKVQTEDGTPVWLVKPQTYMNRCGAALAPFRGSPGFDPARHLLVLADDVALPPGRFRLRASGSAGGHNGLRSIEAALRSQEYARLRIGVGAKPPEWDDLADWVLSDFAAEDRAALDEAVDAMADAVECWLLDGIEPAMNRYNRT